MSADEYNKLVSEVYDAYDAYRSGVKGRSFGQREQKWTDALRGPVMGDENYTAAGKAPLAMSCATTRARRAKTSSTRASTSCSMQRASM